MATEDDPEPGDLPPPLRTREMQLWPFDWYRERRAEGAVHWDEGRGCWDAFGYDAVASVLRDPTTFSSDIQRGDGESTVFGDSMLFSDPPHHTDLREPVEEYFTPGAVASLEPEIRETAESLLDDALDGETGTVDVVEAIAYPLPIVTIAALIGVPTEDRAQFKEWSDRVVNAPQMSGDDARRAAARNARARDELVSYFLEMLEERRDDPRDDLLSALVHGTDLDDYELLTTTALLLVAGNVTTTNLVTNAVRCFLAHDCVDAVTRDGAALSRAIEEVLRYRSPVQRTARVATEPAEVAGRAVDAGEPVICWIGSANRDGSRIDSPRAFRPDRSPNPHVAFGRGIHVCLGAPLARLEARVALDVLFDRLEDVGPVDTEHEPIPSSFLHGVRSFPVTYRV